MKEYLLFDIETNGFKPDTIFMIVITNLLSGERKTYIGNDEVAIAISRLMDARMLVGHGIKKFDIPVIEKLSGAVFDAELVDTVIMSRDLCDFKKHGLEAWGELIGLPKLPSPDFTKFTPEMVPYCERDVDLNVLVFETLVDVLVETDQDKPYREIIKEYVNGKGL